MRRTGWVLGAFAAGLLAAYSQDSPWSKDRQPKREQAPKNEPARNGEDAGKPRPAEDPLRGLKYRDNYEKALKFIKSEFAKRDWRTVPHLFAGLVFLLDGREEHAEDLERAIALAKAKITDDKSFNGNWFIAYSALFLAIVYAHMPEPDIKGALEEGFKVAERTREDDTKGWGHNKGWGRSSGYYKKGGAVDLGIVTATMFSAMVLAREAGVQVPRNLIGDALNNLHSIARGGVVTYGTANGVTLHISRSCAAFPGLHYGGMRSDPIYSAVLQQLPNQIRNTERAHAYGPIHFFADILAAQLCGQFHNYANYWLPILSQRQNDAGGTSMGHDGGRRGQEGPELGATAVYALMILMQKKELAPKPNVRKGPADAKGPPRPGGSSPFRKGRPRVESKDVPTGDAPTGPVTGDGKKEN